MCSIDLLDSNQEPSHIFSLISNDSDLVAIFRKIDGDDDGKIRVSDFRHRLNKISDKLLSDEEKAVMLDKADPNRDGDITIHEFREWAKIGLDKRIMFRMSDWVIAKDQRQEVYSYLSHYRCCPPPMFMILVTLAQIGVFVYYSLSEHIEFSWNSPATCPGCYDQKYRPGLLVFTPKLRYEGWRYFSYLLVHASFEHILANVLLQLLLGIPLELVHQFWRVGPLYLCGVAFGSLLHYFATDNYSVLVGGSGGCYALIAAHLSNVVINWSEMEHAWIRLLVVSVFVITDVGHAIWRAVSTTTCSRISYMAHVGGAMAGLLLGLLILKNLRQLHWERVMWWITLCMFILLVVALIVPNIIFAPGILYSIKFFNCTSIARD